MEPLPKIKLSGLMLLMTIIIVLLAACGGENQTPADTSGANLDLGKRVFQANCSPCHSTEKGMVLVGPSMAGLSGRAGSIVDGLDAEGYIRQSILEPAAFLNDGYQNLMPATYGQQLSGEEIDAVIEYLMAVTK